MSRTGALMDDISKVVREKANLLYPDQPFEKVPVRIHGRAYNVLAYPEYMIQEFVNDTIAEFIEKNEPFDAKGNVVYGRHVITAEEHERRSAERIKAKYGEYPPPRPQRNPAPAPPKKPAGTGGKISFTVTRRGDKSSALPN